MKFVILQWCILLQEHPEINRFVAAPIGDVALDRDRAIALHAAELGEAFGVQKLVRTKSLDAGRLRFRGLFGEVVFFSHLPADDSKLLRYLVLEFLDLGARLTFPAWLRGVSRFERSLALGNQVVGGFTLGVGKQILQFRIGE